MQSVKLKSGLQTISHANSSASFRVEGGVGGWGERIRVITGVKKAGNLVIICKKTESDSALMPF